MTYTKLLITCYAFGIFRRIVLQSVIYAPKLRWKGRSVLTRWNRTCWRRNTRSV